MFSAVRSTTISGNKPIINGWTDQGNTSGPGNFTTFSDLTYFNNKYIGTDFTYLYYTANNGVSWFSFALPSTTNPLSYGYPSLAASPTAIVAISNNDPAFARSPIGTETTVTWTRPTVPIADYWQAIEYGNGRFYVVGATNATLSSGNDGVTWMSAGPMPVGSGNSWNSIKYNSANNTWVVLGYAGSTTNQIAVSNNNGSTWTSYTIPGGYNDWIKMAYGAGTLVAIRATSTGSTPVSAIAYSTNSTTWQATAVPSITGTANWQDITYGRNGFVAVSQEGVSIWSRDGKTWYNTTSKPQLSNAGNMHIAYSATLDNFCIVGGTMTSGAYFSL
jgi:hypothetical protein